MFVGGPATTFLRSVSHIWMDPAATVTETDMDEISTRWRLRIQHIRLQNKYPLYPWIECLESRLRKKDGNHMAIAQE